MKTCFKCHCVLPLSEFYDHPRMADGKLGKCKTCMKADVKKNYRDNRGHYVEYEKLRFKDPKRKAALIVIQRNRREREPDKYHARNAVGNALRDKRLFRKPCEVCGSKKSQAHHDDYSKPLDVRWLCFKHHREHHGQTVT